MNNDKRNRKDERKVEVLEVLNEMLQHDEDEEIKEKVLKLKKCNRKLNKLLKKMKKIDKSIIKVENNKEMEFTYNRNILIQKKINLQDKIITLRSKKESLHKRFKELQTNLTKIQ